MRPCRRIGAPPHDLSWPACRQLLIPPMPPPSLCHCRAVAATVEAQGAAAAAGPPSAAALEALAAAGVKRPRPSDDGYAWAWDTQRGATVAGSGRLVGEASSRSSGAASMGGGGGSKRRMTSEQMAALVESVRTHVKSCPDRYTQLVIGDMRDRWPGLELNMGQVRTGSGAWGMWAYACVAGEGGCMMCCSVSRPAMSTTGMRLPAPHPHTPHMPYTPSYPHSMSPPHADPQDQVPHAWQGRRHGRWRLA